jgi:hypothetical protein
MRAIAEQRQVQALAAYQAKHEAEVAKMARLRAARLERER